MRRRLLVLLILALMLLPVPAAGGSLYETLGRNAMAYEAAYHYGEAKILGYLVVSVYNDNGKPILALATKDGAKLWTYDAEVDVGSLWNPLLSRNRPIYMPCKGAASEVYPPVLAAGPGHVALYSYNSVFPDFDHIWSLNIAYHSLDAGFCNVVMTGVDSEGAAWLAEINWSTGEVVWNTTIAGIDPYENLVAALNGSVLIADPGAVMVVSRDGGVLGSFDLGLELGVPKRAVVSDLGGVAAVIYESGVVIAEADGSGFYVAKLYPGEGVTSWVVDAAWDNAGAPDGRARYLAVLTRDSLYIFNRTGEPPVKFDTPFENEGLTLTPRLDWTGNTVAVLTGDPAAETDVMVFVVGEDGVKRVELDPPAKDLPGTPSGIIARAGTLVVFTGTYDLTLLTADIRRVAYYDVFHQPGRLQLEARLPRMYEGVLVEPVKEEYVYLYAGGNLYRHIMRPMYMMQPDDPYEYAARLGAPTIYYANKGLYDPVGVFVGNASLTIDGLNLSVDVFVGPASLYVPGGDGSWYMLEGAIIIVRGLVVEGAADNILVGVTVYDYEKKLEKLYTAVSPGEPFVYNVSVEPGKTSILIALPNATQGMEFTAYVAVGPLPGYAESPTVAKTQYKVSFSIWQVPFEVLENETATTPNTTTTTTTATPVGESGPGQTPQTTSTTTTTPASTPGEPANAQTTQQPTTTSQDTATGGGPSRGLAPTELIGIAAIIVIAAILVKLFLGGK